MKKLFLSFWIILFSYSLQGFSEASDASIYFEKRIEQVRISIVAGKIKIKSEVYEKRFFKEAVNPEIAKENVYLSGFETLIKINSGLAHPKGNGKFKYQSAVKTTKQSEVSGSTFYSDQVKYVVEFPQVLPGSYSVLSYETEMTIPQFLSRFYFTDYYPAEESRFTVIVDPNIDLGFKLYGDQKDQVKFTKEERESETVYEWILTDAKSLAMESGNSGFLHASTHIVPYIKSYNYGNTTIPVLGSVQDLFDFYQDLLDDIKPKDNTALKQLTLEIIEGAETDLERAKRIFYWVQENIRYVAIEDGWRGFVPYPAADICHKRYGDCKDMSHLLVTMMRFAGLEAEHTWIGTRKLPYTYEDTPCPSVDNHLIAKATIDGVDYFLDATNAYTPFGIPTTFILSKQSLSKGSNGEYKLIYIPSYTPEFCTVLDSINITTKGNNAIGTGTKYVETFEYSYFYNRYMYSNADRESFIREYLNLGQNNFKLTNYELVEVAPHEKTAINFSYEIPNYLKSFGERAFVNLNLSRPFFDQVLANDRSRNYEIDYKELLNTVVEYELPDGKSAVNLPENILYDSEVGRIEASYSVIGNTLIYNRKISIKVLEILPPDAEEWNKFIKELNGLYNTLIELK